VSAIVLCGDAHTAPDLAVGPFATIAAAEAWADEQHGQPARYAVAMVLTPPEEAG